MGDGDGRWRHAEPLCDQRFERFISTAGLRHRAHARLQHALAAKILDADGTREDFGLSLTGSSTLSRLRARGLVAGALKLTG